MFLLKAEGRVHDLFQALQVRLTQVYERVIPDGDDRECR